jgi:F0F1-type ATP synthase alpha subunit
MRGSKLIGGFIFMAEIVNDKGSVVESSTGIETGEVAVEKTYTESEVQALLQREGDRRVSSALKKQQKEFERQTAEADKLRDMDESQRKEYEYTQRLQELENKEREFAIAQNKLEATKVMANRELPIEFVDYIVAEDAETMMENITAFERAFKSAVADAVAKKIASPAPKSGSAKQTGMTKEEFRKLSVAQQTEIFRTNPELYKQMTR